MFDIQPESRKQKVFLWSPHCCLQSSWVSVDAAPGDHDKTTPVYHVQESEEFQPVNLQSLSCFRWRSCRKAFFLCLSFSYVKTLFKKSSVVVHHIWAQNTTVLPRSRDVSSNTTFSEWKERKKEITRIQVQIQKYACLQYILRYTFLQGNSWSLKPTNLTDTFLKSLTHTLCWSHCGVFLIN